MELRIDQDFQSLCPPLTEEEYEILEKSLREEGCRQPLDVWFPTSEESPFILDGHNRYEICLEYGIPFDVTPVEIVTNREEAWDWIISRQMGRRNISEEQKSYLRGKRYNLEKKAQGAPIGNDNAEKQSSQSDYFVLDSEESSGNGTSESKSPEKTVERLSEEYGVSPKTIQRDAEYAESLDELDKKVHPGIREEVLKPKSKSSPKKPTRKQVVDTAKVIRKQSINLKLGFLKLNHWKEYERLEAINILAELPIGEHDYIDALLNKPFIPGSEGINILRNLQHLPETRRQQIYQLQQSSDPREQSLALTIAAKKAPSPDPQTTIAFNAMKAIDDLCRVYRAWMKDFPLEPWMHELREMEMTVTSHKTRVSSIRDDINAKHQERISLYVDGAE